MNELEVFTAALELQDETARDKFLDEACGGRTEVRARMAALIGNAADASRYLESPPQYLQATLDEIITERVGTQIGPYKLLEQIGEGGMGFVYMAQQTEPVKRRVALKLIKPGMDTRQVIARFEAERQALALMDHPHIARVLDAGATEAGRPYFVMELVYGIPITEYCNRERLDTRQRLKLLQDVCRAVQHAHQKAIIHRDLKPSNVMVAVHDGEAVVKVIDFGVAKALDQELTDRTLFTAFSQMVGTPLYMSPEQAASNAADVDTRSDVYSLGVLLYELLTGATPFDRDLLKNAGIDELRRIIREDDPPRPSARISTLHAAGQLTVASSRNGDPRKLSESIRGELDWIVMKTLEKDRNRRYDSANALAADVQRYLDDEPVHACPPSTWYRLRKFAKRHTGLLATAALLLSMMVVATGISLSYSVQAEQQRKKAVDAQKLADRRLVSSRLDFGRALKALDAVVAELSSAEFAQIPGVVKTRSDVLDRMLKLYEEIAKEHADDPYARQQQAIAYGQISDILDLTGQLQESHTAINQGVKILEGLLKENPDDEEYKLHLEKLLFKRLHLSIRPEEDRLKDAERALKLAQELVESPAGGDAFGLGLLHLKVADLLPKDSPQAEQHLADSIRIPEDHGLTPHPGSYIMLAQRAEAKGESAEAEKNYRLGIDGYRRSAHAGHRVDRGILAEHCVDFAKLLNAMGRPDEAKVFQLEAIGNARQLLREYGKLPSYETILIHPVRSFLQDARTDEQKAVAAQLIHELGAELPENESLHTTIAGYLLGLDDAEARLTAAIRSYPRQYAYWECRGNIFKSRGELQMARADYLRALQLAADSPNPIERQAGLRGRLSEIYLADEQYQEAVNVLTPACTEEPVVFWLYKRRAEAYFGLHQFDKAVEDLSKAVELRPSDFSPLSRISSERMANCPDAAFRSGMLALADRVVLLNSGSANALLARGHVRIVWGETDLAMEDFEEALQIDPNNGRICNCVAWYLARYPVADVRLAKRAMELAQKAVSLIPDDPSLWNTLGVSRFRANEYERAIESLEKSEELSNGSYLAFNAFFLAMAHWQLDDKGKAREWYDRAVESMKTDHPENDELLRIRKEAEELMREPSGATDP